MKQLTIKERVANGCRWLDENFHGWESRIDIDTLKLNNSVSCICGQLFAPQAAKARKLRSNRRWQDDVGYFWAVNNLFTEANSWITTIVGEVVIGQKEYNRIRVKDIRTPRESEAMIEVRKRTGSVAEALGFYDSRGMFEGLQKEWTRVLKARQRATVGSA